jgi:hypothetical protein
MSHTCRACYAGTGPAGAIGASRPARLFILGRCALLLWLLLVPATRASCEEPDLMQTLIAEDATLNNNLSPIEPRWQKNSEGRALELGFGVEKMLSPRLDIEIGGQWDSLSPRDGPAGAGFGNVDLALKYVFLELAHFQFVVVPQLGFPTSSHIRDEPMEVHVGGALTWGGRLGSAAAEHGVPVYLQAIELQGDVGYSHGFGGSGSDEIFFDPVVDYSMPYLDYATGRRSPWPLRNLCVFNELNFNEPLSGSSRAALSLFATPGIAYVADTYQVTVGVQLPLTHAAEKNEQMAVIGSLIIFLDQIDPRFSWMPF